MVGTETVKGTRTRMGLGRWVLDMGLGGGG